MKNSVVQHLSLPAKSAFVAPALLAAAQVSGQIVISASSSFPVHAEGPTAAADYYASGNEESGFEEFGIAEFSASQSDFGGEVTDLIQVVYRLTYNDRDFTSDGTFEVFFSSIQSADWSGLSYDTTTTTGLNDTQFLGNEPISLGQFEFTAIADSTPGGSLLTYTLSLDAAAEQAIIESINFNTPFSLIVAGIDPTVDATFSGVGNTFDPGDPALAFTASVNAVPEPATYVLFAGLGVLALVGWRRRSIRRN